MFSSIVLLGIAIFALVVLYGSQRHHARVAKLCATVLTTTTLSALAFVPSVSASPTLGSQAPLSIANSILTGHVGTSVTLITDGGSGSGALSFKATGKYCVVKTKYLSATMPTSCVVTATKAKDRNFNAASSHSVTFVFLGKTQSALVLHSTSLSGVAGKPVTLSTTGGTGKGAVSYQATGSHCTITKTSLTASAMTTCSVTATKAGLAGYANAISAPVVVTFIPATFQIINSQTNGTVGTPITVIAEGGSLTGTASYAVTGVGCTINASSGVLNASAAATCAVSATLKANGKVVATAPSVSFGFTVENPTVAHPDVATLTSVTGTRGAQINDTATGQVNFINQYFNHADHWYVNYLAAGATVVMNWHVNGSNGIPLANAAVTLHTNLDYSCAAGVTWTTSSLNVYPGCNGGSEGTLAGTTDANGNVSFTLVNTNLVGGSAPADMTTTAGVTANEGSTFPWTDTLLQVTNDTYTGNPATQINQATDRVDFIVIPSSSKVDAPTVAHPDVATLTSVTGQQGSQIDDTTRGDSEFIYQYYNPTDHWYGNYISNGATVTMTWHVKGSNGQALPNAPVTLQSNLAYSCANGVTWTTESLNVYPGCNAGAQGSLAGITDANGNVTFHLTNTNTDTGTTPSDTTTGAGMEHNEATLSWTDMLLQVGNDVVSGNPSTEVNQATDRVDFLVLPSASGSTPTGPTYANPDVATMTSVTGGVNATPLDFTWQGDNWFINQYYSPSDHWNFTYIVQGSSITVNWHVDGYDGAPLAHTAVTLHTTFGGNDANWTAAEMDSQGNIAGTTDASGNVSFTLTNGDSGLSASPTNTTSAATAQGFEGAAPWTRMVLVVGSDVITAGTARPTVNQATDLTDFIVVPSAGSGSGSTAPAGATYAHPDVATVTSTTNTINTTPYDKTADGDQWFIWQYFSGGDRWLLNYVTQGSTITQTWHVVDYTGAALKNTTVTLMTSYAGNDTHWSATGMVNGNVAGTTDASGNVSFTLTNTDTGITATPSMGVNPGAGAGGESTNPYSRMALVIGTVVDHAGHPATDGAVGSVSDTITAGVQDDINQATDLVDIIVAPSAGSGSGSTAPAGATYTHPDVATLTSITGAAGPAPIDFTYMGDGWFIWQYFSGGDRWLFNYVTQGTSITETWHVADSSGAALANATVTLMTGYAGVGSHWTATGIDSRGFVTGTTDANGNVSFSITNTDTGVTNVPADLTGDWTANGAEYYQTNPWARTVLVIGTPVTNAGYPATDGAVGSVSDTITAGVQNDINQATDLVDLIVVP